MLYFEKSQPAPECLEQEKRKAAGDYKCGEVLERIKDDFYNKCYICEDSHPHSINVEHFRPHKGDVDLKFSWDNLFWSCAHCNNLKSDNFDDILDCTNRHDDIENKIRYDFKPFPFEKVKITPLNTSPNVVNTATLIESVFNGTTKLKTIEASNIRDKLLKEIKEFQEYLLDYFHPTCDPSDKEFFKKKIISHLHIASCFTSFKRCIIKNNPALRKEFSEYL